MLTAFEIFGSVAGVSFLTVISYGALTENKRLLSLGICLFSIIPITGEVYLYLLSDHSIHLFFLLIFWLQMMISLPTKSSSKSSIYLSKKIRLAILVFNLLHGLLILSVLFNIPLQFGFMHLVVALTMLYTIVKTNQK
jgi:heme A synthase